MAKRVGYRCSNPSCKKPTCGASDNPNNYSNIGVQLISAPLLVAANDTILI